MSLFLHIIISMHFNINITIKHHHIDLTDYLENFKYKHKRTDTNYGIVYYVIYSMHYTIGKLYKIVQIKNVWSNKRFVMHI